ncbi:MAG: MGMT family protein [Eubacterium sp.]
MSLSEKIYNAVKQIPFGRVATYGQIAVMCGNPHYARAVGNALHKNPSPDTIPCYRVVNAKGFLTKSFAFGGLHTQAELLKAEGIEVVDGRVDLKKYQWRG